MISNLLCLTAQWIMFVLHFYTWYNDKSKQSNTILYYGVYWSISISAFDWFCFPLLRAHIPPPHLFLLLISASFHFILWIFLVDILAYAKTFTAKRFYKAIEEMQVYLY